MEQRSAEWFEARLGKLTASRAADAFDVLKKPDKDGNLIPAKKSIDMALEVAFERLTRTRIDHPVNAAMLWGQEHEDEARTEYECATGNLVTQVGLIDHPEIDNLAASPDGLVGDDGLLEIKCPSSLTHMSRVMAGVVPPEYKPQMLMQLLCTGRKWVDFVDYDPRFKKNDLFIIRYEPKPEELEDAKIKAVSFLKRVDQIVQTFEAIK